VLITSYDLLKRDIDMYEDIRFNYEVIDEAQYIKTHTTVASKSVKLINSSRRFALTGTPIENRLSELWSIFDYLMPGYLYDYETFKREIENQVVKYKNEDATTRLKRMVSPFILRRLKDDVLKDLPAKLEEIRYAKLEGEQRKIYDGQVVHMKNMLETQDESEFQKNKIKILAELTKIRQICCNPSLLLEDYNGESAKTQACLDLIESAHEGGHKMLVFSQFTSMLAILEKELESRGIAYYKITGETKKEKRIELVNKFNQDDTPVFLISLKAGGTGLNLTGADIVIHYDPWWNVAVQNQATDRAHRIGQTRTVSVYKLIVKNSIEEKIVKMQEDKKNLADEILSGEMGSIGQMSKEDLLELIG
jgi:SNF2 family DNA or RNA helicase